MNNYFCEFKRGIKTSIPVTIGFVSFGLLLGGQAAQKGMSSLEVLLMTSLNYGGGSEFAAVNLWTDPPRILLIVSVLFLINSRHFLMGAILSPYLKDFSYRKNFFLLFFMCDESWALSLADIQKQKIFILPYYMGVALALYLAWAISTFIGAYASGSIGDLTRYGFDMAFPAVFLVILKGMWKNHRMSLAWIISLVTSVITYLFIPGAWYVPVGTLVGAIAAWCLA